MNQSVRSSSNASNYLIFLLLSILFIAATWRILTNTTDYRLTYLFLQICTAIGIVSMIGGKKLAIKELTETMTVMIDVSGMLIGIVYLFVGVLVYGVNMLLKSQIVLFGAVLSFTSGVFMLLMCFRIGYFRNGENRVLPHNHVPVLYPIFVFAVTLGVFVGLLVKTMFFVS